MHRLQAIVATAGLLIATACGINGTSPSPSVCDGIPADWGGCDADRPTFTGETCQEVAAEFGEQLSPSAIQIFDGPQTVDGNDRTVQLARLVVVHIQLANKHLRDTGHAVSCDVPEFLEGAETHFSQEFKDRVGSNAFFGQTVSYEEWREDLKRFLVVIDRDESEPYDPSQTGEPTAGGS